MDLVREYALIDRMLDDAQQRVQKLGRASTPMVCPTSLRQIIRRRRLREAYFGAGLFADPAWDILIELAVSRLEGQVMPVSSACVAAAAPATTALRWLNVLVERGLVAREPDPLDKRRVYVRLTEQGWRRMAAYLEDAGIAAYSDEP